MRRELSTREREVALAMIAHATTSPDEVDWATFTPEQKEGWDEPVPITEAQRDLWAAELAQVIVTNECGCGGCPSIGMRPQTRADDSARSDVGGEGDFSERIVLDAGVDGAMLLLFVDDDSPSYLELAPIHEGRQYSEFPPVDTIKF